MVSGTPPVAPLVVALGGFEGPLDLLLDLARRQRVDLATLDVVALVDQYLAYLRDALRRELEIAADYLVMAAWLVWLKSRLLLPAPPSEADAEAPDGEALIDRLRRLEQVRACAAELAMRPMLGVGRFARGAPEPLRIARDGPWRVSLAELARAHLDAVRTRGAPVMRVTPPRTYPVEAALQHLERILTGGGWRDLAQLAPRLDGDDDRRRSALASTFVAGLELARQGRVEIRQIGAYAPVMVRAVVR